MLGKKGNLFSTKNIEKYLTAAKFSERFPDEKACVDHLFELKYQCGYKCSRCNSEKFYRLHGFESKRNRIIQCAYCKKQESLTANTVFHRTRTPLLKWYWAFFFISQNKKGISSLGLSKLIGVGEMTGWLIFTKIRKSMEEDSEKYKIGGPGRIVEADEIDIGGKGSPKQKALVLLEKSLEGKIGRIRFSPIPDKSADSICPNLLAMVKKGTEIHTDGAKSYLQIENISINNLFLKQISHSEENHTHSYLKDLNTIVGNLKKWYRGTHYHFAHKNAAYYLNEFAYRFNRRRTESNIFDRLLARSVQRPQIVTYKEAVDDSEYLPLAS